MTVDERQHEDQRETSVVVPDVLWVFVSQGDDGWDVVALDYTIVGHGPTRESAIESMLGQLGLYLEACRREGLSAGESERPVPVRWRVEFRARAAWGWVERRIRFGGHRDDQEGRFLTRGGLANTG